ncbi:hypothetical protein MUO32_23775 [Shinella sp. CPCC 101442]|uniref:hypothetical protein n=1 Tax=Shinella sp. CPCC 101442 TaxID=2932265 RepID=UPI0021524F9D|nr:hypothetical protein [Shinella sp. CPCC 101442]MCR6502051.1 hypothetical protein [Shinella sp. CPCC 101442]
MPEDDSIDANTLELVRASLKTAHGLAQKGRLKFLVYLIAIAMMELSDIERSNPTQA